MSNTRLPWRGLTCILSFANCERGGATLWNLTWLLAFGIMGGLTIDSTNARRMQTIMQSTADAAALAAAIEYSQTAELDLARKEAEKFTWSNMPISTFGTVLDKDADVVFGNWEKDGDVESYGERWVPGESNGTLPDDLEINAVMVALRRTNANGNPVGASLLELIGFSGWEVQTYSIALIPTADNCYNKGLLTKGRFASQSNNQWLDGLCIYAEEYIQFGSDVYGDDDIVIMQDHGSDELLLGSSGTGIFPASNSDSAVQDFKDEHVQIEKLDVDLPDMIPEWYDTLSAWTVGAPWPKDFSPPFVPNAASAESDVEEPTAGTVYINSSSIVFKAGNADDGKTLQNVVAIAGDTISIDSSITTIRNVLFLAHKHDSSGAHQGVIDIPSSTAIGDAGYCNSGSGWSRFAASKDLKVGSNSRIAGAQFVAGLNLYLGSDGVSTKGIAAQVGTTYYAENDDPKIEPAGSSIYGGCGAGFINTGGPPVRLVF